MKLGLQLFVLLLETGNFAIRLSLGRPEGILPASNSRLQVKYALAQQVALGLQLLILLLEEGNFAIRPLRAISRLATAASRSIMRWLNRSFSACASASAALVVAARTASISASGLARQRFCGFAALIMMKVSNMIKFRWR
jgi:hypothetical protein